MNAFWTALAFKATLWASILGVASMLVPAVLPRWRRAMALIGIWGLWLLPFMPALPMHGAQQGVSLPMATVSWPWMTWAWALGAVIGGLRLLREGIQLIHCTRKAHQGCVEGMEVHFSAEVAGPCMTGWLRPRVFLPEEASQWSAAAVNAALRHELQHVRQHDGLHRLVAAVLRAVFWWNPAVHALCSIYENESEVCCDLEAAEGVMTRREYGHLLLAHACGDHTMVLAPLFALRSKSSAPHRTAHHRATRGRRCAHGALDDGGGPSHAWWLGDGIDSIVARRVFAGSNERAKRGGTSFAGESVSAGALIIAPRFKASAAGEARQASDREAAVSTGSDRF